MSLIMVFGCACQTASAGAADAPWACADPRIHVSLWSADVVRATQMRFARDGSLWVIELHGKLKRLVETPQGIETTTIMDLGPLAQSYDPELGATSLALAGDFDGQNGTLYIAHNWDASKARLGGISRIQLKACKVVERRMVFGPILSAGAHQVDRMVLEPDGDMLVGIGDAWHPQAAQAADDPHGKIIRLTAAELAQSAKPIRFTVLAKGLRNPFALARRADDGLVVIGNNGADVNDGLYVLVPGANYGWGAPRTEGEFDDFLYRWPMPVSPDGVCFYDRRSEQPRQHEWPAEYAGNLFVAAYGPTQRATTEPMERVRQVFRFSLEKRNTLVRVRRASVFLKPSLKMNECPLDLTVSPQGDLFMLTYGGNNAGVSHIYRIRFESKCIMAPR